MNMLSLKQGSKQWHAARLGKITASRFKDIMSLPKSKTAKEAGHLSGSAMKYLNELTGEIATGQPASSPNVYALRWGSDNEQGALDAYHRDTGVKPVSVGFVQMKGWLIGCSPDAMIGSNGVGEIKCPASPAIHQEYLFGGVVPKDHVLQCQGQMLVTDREWCDFCSFDPRCKNAGWCLFRKRMYRDDKLIEKLWERLVLFHEKLMERIQVLEDMKYVD